jgi:CBS domain-containing protein
MTVRRILQSKGNSDVLTIASGATIGEAAATLSVKGVGALVVSDDGQTLNGVLSERDIVRELGKKGPPCLDDLVSDLMTRDVKTATPDDTAIAVLNKMTAGRFRHLPVLEGGRMIGVISIGDVVKYRMEQIQHENEALTEMIVGHG